MFTDILAKTLDIWHDRHFLKRRTFAPKFRSLGEVLENHELTPQNYVKIIISILKCVQALHDRNMIQDELTAVDLQLRRHTDVSRVTSFLSFTLRVNLRTHKAIYLHFHCESVLKLTFTFDMSFITS